MTALSSVKKLSKRQYEILLAIAICFTNADDTNVQGLGYRIVVEYCNQRRDYIPLYEIAVNKGLILLANLLEKHYIDDSKSEFFSPNGMTHLWSNMYPVKYAGSEQQNLFGSFFESKKKTRFQSLHRLHTENRSSSYRQ